MGRVNLAVVACVLLLHAHSSSAAEDSPTAAYQSQGWTEDEQIQFYFTTQGSQLIPYDWFLALEQPNSTELFRSNENMERLRFIPHPGDQQRNPDALPVGFVKDDNGETTDFVVKESFLGEGYDRQLFPVSESWVGLTCAACHTTDLHHGDTVVRIDGGPAMADVERFLAELAAAVDATSSNDEKMTRFARRVLPDPGYNETEKAALKERVEAYSRVLNQLVRRSHGTTPYGFGRLDAFGSILNEICETALELPENYHPADAPASFPFLWDTPRLDWVQWNGSAGSPIGRNVGEVLGVFGQLRLMADPPQGQFRSTAHLANLYELEQHIAKLTAPAWPAEFGGLDSEKVEAGKSLFAENCVSCHKIKDEDGRYPTRTIGEHDYIQTVLVPVDKIGTDPKLADNFMKRAADPGALREHLPPPFNAMPKVPRPVLLAVAVSGVIKRNAGDFSLTPELMPDLRNHRPEGERPPNPWSYKARPLAGIWATAPYLHNGSVPSLYDLLLPDYERPTRFHVGNREFDPKRVGFVSDPEQGTFLFRVLDERGQVIPGNSNAGHSGRSFTHRRSEDGTLREFTDAERWALVEYMKTLR